MCRGQAANCRLEQEAGSAIQYLFIYIFAFAMQPLHVTHAKNSLLIAIQYFYQPCALIATVEMMGNQMAEIEDFKLILKLVQRELQIKGNYV